MAAPTQRCLSLAGRQRLAMLAGTLALHRESLPASGWSASVPASHPTRLTHYLGGYAQSYQPAFPYRISRGWRACNAVDGRTGPDGEGGYVPLSQKASAVALRQNSKLWRDRSPGRHRPSRRGRALQPPRFERTAGKAMMASAPPSGRFASVSVPPCSWTASRASERPRPELLAPVSGRVKE